MRTSELWRQDFASHRHHHDDIVKRFITTPTASIGDQHKERITASGLPA